jgi:hypothetical protein
MPTGSADASTKNVAIEATVTKADGFVIDYGVISYNGKNPFKKLLFKATNLFHHADNGIHPTIAAIQRRFLIKR